MWLKDLHEVYPAFRALAWVERSGIVSAIDPPRRADGIRVMSAPFDVSKTDYFVQTVATGRPFLTDAIMGREMGADPLVRITAPVKNPDGSVRAVLSASLYCRSFKDLGTSVASLTEGEIMILDRNDRVIYATPRRSVSTA